MENRKAAPHRLIALKCVNGPASFADHSNADSANGLGISSLQPDATEPDERKIDYMDIEPASASRIDPSTLLIDPTATAPEATLPSPDALRRHSIKDMADEIAANAQQQTPLLDNVCLHGQATVWYASPNTGKTMAALNLLLQAVHAGRIPGSAVYYINADDSSVGVLEKLNLLTPKGIETLVPGYRDFEASDLMRKLRSMASTGSARGKFVILDTLKKFTTLMDKREASEFGRVARQFVMQGGTILALAHTNKARSQKGKPVYAGTTDILEDFDCGFTIDEVEQPDSGKRVIEFECIKARGNVAQRASYSYSLEQELSYADRLASLIPVAPDEVEMLRAAGDADDDEAAIEVIKACIYDGYLTKTDLMVEAAKRLKIGRKKVGAIIERYAGEDLAQHHWKFEVVDRGEKRFDVMEPRRTGPIIDPNDQF